MRCTRFLSGLICSSSRGVLALHAQPPPAFKFCDAGDANRLHLLRRAFDDFVQRDGGAGQLLDLSAWGHV
jgi:hypothetical protein